jgi:hypothetical protein
LSRKGGRKTAPVWPQTHRVVGVSRKKDVLLRDGVLIDAEAGSSFRQERGKGEVGNIAPVVGRKGMGCGKGWRLRRIFYVFSCVTCAGSAHFPA